jgi:hypothetical protein
MNPFPFYLFIPPSLLSTEWLIHAWANFWMLISQKYGYVGSLSFGCSMYTRDVVMGENPSHV